MTRIRTIATMALLLLVVTAGSAAAGALITGARIKDNTVTGVDVRDQSLTGRDVLDRSLTVEDFLGLEQGPKGEAGPQGTPGTNGVPEVTPRVAGRTVLAGQRKKWTSLCNVNETAVGGGVSSDRPDLLAIEESFPDGFHWGVQVRNTGNISIEAFAWALCVPV